jgi:polysaccharide deacetylase 2 family uncharacterized protein YibQ
MKTINPVKGNPKTPWIIYFIFSILALISAIGLDYINWTNGEKSYFFSLFGESQEPGIPEIPLDQIILDGIASQGIPEESISRFKDKAGTDHMKLDISQDEYARLEARLKRDLQGAMADIAKQEKQEDEEKIYFLWDVERGEHEKLAILFSCKKDVPGIAEKLYETAGRNRVALIMDDMGYSLDAIYDILSLEEPITIAIIPFSPVGEQTAQIAHQNGLEILLHLPMESINGSEDYNALEGMISTEMSEQDVIMNVERNLDQVPFISGVNNHMGSKVTPDESLMRIILQRLKQRNLFFVDSRTTGKSVAYDVALQLEIPTAQRHVFLDNELNEDAIRKKLEELFTLAQSRGEAVGICHPLPETIKVLKDYFRLAEEYGVRPVFVSELVR